LIMKKAPINRAVRAPPPLYNAPMPPCMFRSQIMLCKQVWLMWMRLGVWGGRPSPKLAKQACYSSSFACYAVNTHTYSDKIFASSETVFMLIYLCRWRAARVNTSETISEMLLCVHPTRVVNFCCEYIGNMKWNAVGHTSETL
jgi:hypothetical protein